MSHASSIIILESVWEKIVNFFKNIDYNLFFLIVSLVLAFLIFLLVFIGMLVERKRLRHFHSRFSNDDSSPRIVTINSPHQNVTTFSLRDMANKQTETMSSFYSHFPSGERRRLISWIDGLLDGHTENPYVVVALYAIKDRSQSLFYRVIKADPTIGVIHLECYSLDYSRPARSSAKIFSNEAEFAQALKVNGSATGMTFCFHLLRTKAPVDIHTDLPKAVAAHYARTISHYAIGNQKVITLSPHEIALANFDYVNVSDAILFALWVKNGVEKEFANFSRRYSKLGHYEVRCGIVVNKDLLGDSDEILKESRRCAEAACNSAHPIIIFEKNKRIESTDDSMEFQTEIDRIIEERRISYSFRPIYDAKHMSIYGYISKASPVGTSFGSIDELKNFAIRADAQKTLFSSIVKHTIPRFNNERFNKEQKLFFPVRMDERATFVPFFTRYRSAKETNLYLLFREDDVTNALDQPGIDEFIAQISGLKAKGYRMALVMRGNTLALDRSLYSICDAFLVEFNDDTEGAIDAKIRSELHALVEGLLRYHKPIVAANLTTWEGIELVVRSGIDYISSDAFAPYQKMFKPVAEKNVERIRAMKERK